MKKLDPAQLSTLKEQLSRSEPHQALQAELVDHLASEIESLMDQGQTYEVALHLIMLEANPQVIAQLKQSYQQALGLNRLLTLPNRLSTGRVRKRQVAAEQFPVWLRVSMVAFVTLMVCMMWVSQLFAVPLGVFKIVWVFGLTSVLCVSSARLLFRSNSRSLRHRSI